MILRFQKKTREILILDSSVDFETHSLSKILAALYNILYAQLAALCENVD